MADYLATNATTTQLTGAVQAYKTASSFIDAAGNQKQTYWDFPYAHLQLGYYKRTPQLKKAIDALATWATGKGFIITDPEDRVIINHIRGWGEDSFQSILWNLVIQKKVFGDAFAEIVKEEGKIINLKPLYPGDMRIVVDENGLIEEYVQRAHTKDGEDKTFKPEEILHLSNDRIANEIHGTSIIDACAWVIDAINEAMQDNRVIKHKERGMGVLYVDTQDQGEINQVTKIWKNAIANGEFAVLPKGLTEVQDMNVNKSDRLEWIRYLENFFYQSVGVPRVIATSENYTEAGSKTGYLTFEPIYTREQTELETDIFNQLGIEIKFNRPPSLSGVVQGDEQKNSGQLGIQPSDTQVSATRSE